MTERTKFHWIGEAMLWVGCFAVGRLIVDVLWPETEELKLERPAIWMPGVRVAAPAELPTCEAPPPKDGEPFTDRHRAMRAAVCGKACDRYAPCEERCAKEYDWCSMYWHRFGSSTQYQSCVKDMLRTGFDE